MTIVEMQAWIDAGKNLNDLDGDGNTFLHKLFDKLQAGWDDLETARDWDAIEWALAHGANPLVRNNRGLPGNVFLLRVESELKRYHFQKELDDPHYKFHAEERLKKKLFDLYKKYRPDYEVMVKFSHNELIGVVSIAGLSQDCLEKLKHHVVNLLNDEQRTFEFYKREKFEKIHGDIEDELRLLKEYPDLAETVEILCDSQYKVAISRALLLDANFLHLFTNLCEQLNDLPVGEKRISIVESFAEELSQKQTVLEELDARPTPLTETEQRIAKKLFALLDCALNQRIANQDAHQILLRKDSDSTKKILLGDLQKARIAIIEQVKSDTQHIKNQGLFAEINRQRELIESGKYFEPFKRNKHAAATEMRLSKK